MENLFIDSKNNDETLEDGEITDQESCDDFNETHSINDLKNLSNDTTLNIQSNFSTSNAPSILLNNSNLSKNTLKRKFNFNDETKKEKTEININEKDKMNLNPKNVIMFIKEMKKMMNKISDDKTKKRKVKEVKKTKKAVKKKTQIIKTNIPTNNQICKFFLEGYCQKGTNCTFIHQNNNIKMNKQLSNLPIQNTIKKEICKFYLQDSCDKGDECTFFHEEFPCKFFHTGIECRSGENCKFSHKPLTDHMKLALETHLNSYDVVELKNRRVLLGEPTLQMRNSHDTWSWQQEMKKLESTYSGSKRNLFTIPNDHLIKSEPYNQQSQLIPNFYIDKNCDPDFLKQNYEDSLVKSDNFNLMKNDFNSKNEIKVFDSLNQNYFFKMNEPFKRPDLVEKKDNFKTQEPIRTLINNNQLYQRRDSLQLNSNTTPINSKNFDLSLNNNLNLFKYNFFELDLIKEKTNLLNDLPIKTEVSQSNDNIYDESIITNDNQINSSNMFNCNMNQIKEETFGRTKQENEINKKDEFKINKNEPFIISECEDLKFKLYTVDIEELNFSEYENIFTNNSNASNDPRLKNYFSSKNSNTSKKEAYLDLTFLFGKSLDTNDVIPQGLSELRLKKVEN